ncbi:hypothetical protein GGS20DRAFT_569711 [Poronia punctata]|nr:hypothetical protein GGS20DRAFT_569711 [Poronia punctata]
MSTGRLSFSQVSASMNAARAERLAQERAKRSANSRRVPFPDTSSDENNVNTSRHPRRSKKAAGEQLKHTADTSSSLPGQRVAGEQLKDTAKTPFPAAAPVVGVTFGERVDETSELPVSGSGSVAAPPAAQVQSPAYVPPSTPRSLLRDDEKHRRSTEMRSLLKSASSAFPACLLIGSTFFSCCSFANSSHFLGTSLRFHINRCSVHPHESSFPLTTYANAFDIRSSVYIGDLLRRIRVITLR